MRKNRRAQLQPEGGHPQAADPAALPPDVLAGVKPPAPTTEQRRLQAMESDVRAIVSEVQDLAARVEDLEQTAVPRLRPMDRVVEHGPAAESRLQDVLPEVKDLALKVGGLEQLFQIVETLKQSTE
jgi:hypothetical protein